jgi:uncharacterized protein
MGSIPDDVELRARDVAARLRARAAAYQPDENPDDVAKVNDDLNADLAALSGSLNSTAIELDVGTALPHQLRETADAIDDVLAHRTPKRTAEKGPWLGTTFFVMVVLAIFTLSPIRSCYRSGMDRWHAYLRGNAAQRAATPVSFDQPPPKPAKYMTDFAGVIEPDRAARLNEMLAAFERETSNQVVVYVAPSLPSDRSIEEAASSAFSAWGIGQKGRDNGVLFLVFINDRQMRIEVGYGLEGVLTDAVAKQITSDVVKPYFKREDYGRGVEAGTRAIMSVSRGEGFSGSGLTVAERAKAFSAEALGFVLVVSGILLGLFVISGFIALWLRAAPSSSGGGSSSGDSDSSWSSSSSSSSSSSDSSFSGGGGGSGGGGASDRW